MGIKDKLGGLAATFDGSRGPSVATDARARSAPVKLATFSQAFKEQEARLRELEQAHGMAIELPLSEIVENPLHAQIRRLSHEQVNTLVEHLRENPLASPITVRRIEHGYELISGRHRVEAFRRLGRTHIPAIIRDYSEEDAERALVFDNFIRPNLSDFERYLGIAALRDRLGWSYQDLKEQTGLSRSLISQLMSFSRLSPHAHEVLRANPAALSWKQLRQLIDLSADDEQLSEIVIDIAESRTSFNGALAKLRGRPPQSHFVRHEICDSRAQRLAVVKQREGVISVELAAHWADDAHVQELHRGILALLEAYAKRDAAPMSDDQAAPDKPAHDIEAQAPS